jgi:hypothetical protein
VSLQPPVYDKGQDIALARGQLKVLEDRRAPSPVAVP